jgi:hypothetical protein
VDPGPILHGKTFTTSEKIISLRLLKTRISSNLPKRLSVLLEIFFLFFVVGISNQCVHVFPSPTVKRNIKSFHVNYFQEKTLKTLLGSAQQYRVSQVFPPERKHPLLINLKFLKNSGMIVYHCRTIPKNFKIFNETGKDFVLIQ